MISGGLCCLLALYILIFSTLINTSFAQIPSDPGIKIVTPSENSTVPSGELTVAGISTDNSTTNCQIFVDLNDMGPYQNVTAAGPSGEGDYSNWTFTFTSDYHLIGNGTNEITSKLYCTDDGVNNATKYFSRNVTGIAAAVAGQVGTGNNASSILPSISNSTTPNSTIAVTNSSSSSSAGSSVQPVSFNLLKSVPLGFVAEELVATPNTMSDETASQAHSPKLASVPIPMPLPIRF